MIRQFCLFSLAILLTAAAAGCTGRGSVANLGEDAYKTAEQLRILAQAYNEYIAKHRSPPQNWESLKGLTGETNLEDLKISVRDGKPIQVYWGIDASKENMEETLIAHEVDGADGVKYVFTNCGVYKVDEERFRSLPTPK